MLFSCFSVQRAELRCILEVRALQVFHYYYYYYLTVVLIFCIFFHAKIFDVCFFKREWNSLPPTLPMLNSDAVSLTAVHVCSMHSHTRHTQRFQHLIFITPSFVGNESIQASRGFNCGLCKGKHEAGALQGRWGCHTMHNFQDVERATFAHTLNTVSSCHI